MPRLVIMRHAKSSWKHDLPDHERPLNKRGHRDGKAAGEWIARNVGTIDHVLISTSTRTRLTWERVQAGGARAKAVTFDRPLYGGDTQAFLHALHVLPAGTDSAMIIAHWPGVEVATRSLAQRDENPGWAGIDVKFPTSAIAVLEFSGSWQDLEQGQAMLREFVVPRG